MLFNGRVGVLFLIAFGCAVVLTGCSGGGPQPSPPDTGQPDSGVGPEDAGPKDAGGDAGTDSGTDAGIDAGVDAGIDAGIDAGTDGGVDITKKIEQSGGTVEAPNGMKIVFPAGAVDKPTLIHVKSTEVNVRGVTRAGDAYFFEPPGIVFKQPVFVTMPFNGAMPANMALYWSKLGDEKSFERIIGSAAGNLYTAEVTHFSTGFPGSPSKVRPFGTITSGGERINSTNYQVDLYIAPSVPVGKATSPGHRVNLGPAALETAGRGAK